MPFRLWHTICWIAPSAFALLVLGAVFRDDNEATAVLFVSAVGFLVVTAALGAVLVTLLLFGKLRMRCPFCKTSGPAGGNRQMGLFMHCPKCGLIRGVGFLKWRLVRDQRERQAGHKNVPLSRRPGMIPLFPRGIVYFRTWRSLRWFLLMLVPVVASATAAICRQQFVFGVAFLIFGPVLAAALFVVLSSGMSSSKWNTYFRSREPVRYWFDVILLLIAYTAFSVVGWFIG